jgi:hypothetical protein
MTVEQLIERHHVLGVAPRHSGDAPAVDVQPRVFVPLGSADRFVETLRAQFVAPVGLVFGE